MYSSSIQITMQQWGRWFSSALFVDLHGINIPTMAGRELGRDTYNLLSHWVLWLACTNSQEQIAQFSGIF
jgi:hypothetical protein